MEESISFVPSFAQGLKILLVHKDTLSLVNLSSMLEKYTFKVTVIDEAKAAISMICQQEGQFNLVMTKAHMPDMDALSFLQSLLEKDIPVIFISSGEYNDVTWKALAKGSCYFLEEPILLEDLKYVWQYVYHTKFNSAKKTQNAERVKVHGTHEDRRCKQKEKRRRFGMQFDSSHITAAMAVAEESARQPKYHALADQKKSRIVWTPQLHQKFLDALCAIGDKNNIRPKAILELMNVPNLTARQVSSHLQKYKTEAQIYLSGRFQCPSPSQNQGCVGIVVPGCAFRSSIPEFAPDFPAPSSSLKEIQNQNQFPVNFKETQDSDMLIRTAFSNYETQNLEAVGGQPMADASTDQNQPMTTFDAIQMLEEDWDQYDHYQNGVAPDQVDEYGEMLRNVLLGDDLCSQEPDV